MRSLTRFVPHGFRLFLVALAIGSFSLGEPSEGPSIPTNAALVYWPAFAAMPRLSGEESTLVKASFQEIPLDGAALRPLFAKFAPTFSAIQRALKIPHCDWQLDYRLGPGLPLPQFEKALTAAKLLTLQARFRAAKGETQEASRDLLSALEMSRHIAQNEQLLLAYLVQCNIEKMVYQALSADFTKYDSALLREFDARLLALPSRQPPATVAKREAEVMLAWFVKAERAISASKDGRHDLRILEEEFPSMQEVLAALSTAGAFPAALKRLESDMTLFSTLTELPFSEAVAESDALLQEIAANRAASPLSAIILPSFTTLLRTDMQGRIQEAMVRAAIARRLHGAASKILDPLSGRPFSFAQGKKPEDGFTLSTPEALGEALTFR